MSKRGRVEATCVIVLGLAMAGSARAGEVLWVGAGQTYSTIAAAIGDAHDGDVVIVKDLDPLNTYSGDGFRNLDFAGRRITVRSEGDDPSRCAVDCGGSPHRFVRFHSGETSESVVRGFRIQSGDTTDFATPADRPGGAVYCEGSSPFIVNCAFVNNRAGDGPGGGAIACLGASSPMISSCTFSENEAISSTSSQGWGGAIYCGQFSSPVITNCELRSNRATGGAGAIECCNDSRPIITGCIISGNQTNQYRSAAIRCQTASPLIVNCLIVRNEASPPGYRYGGGIACLASSSPFIANCTIAQNDTGGETGGVYSRSSSSPSIRNCILWDNTDDQAQIVVVPPASATVSYSDIEGGWSGTGNINRDPVFVEPDSNPPPPAPWNDDHYLGPGSPCVDPDFDPPPDSAADVHLNTFSTRVNLQADTGTVDMGYHYPCDCNENFKPDSSEAELGLSTDCNHNGVPDSCDIDPNGYHTSQDTNANGVPDECEGYVEPAAFTSNTDFDTGVLINVNHDVAGELRRYELATPLPYLWVPAGGEGWGRGTVLRIYTGETVSAGEILGEYRTSPVTDCSNPSRTAVDLDGNLWVANRADFDGTNGIGTVVKVGTVIGGTRCDMYGRDDENGGEYLRPPFIYNTCIDRDHDGLIHTSRGLGDATFDDECVCQYVHVTETQPRQVSVDRDNKVWVGGRDEGKFDHLDGETGQILQTVNAGVGGYGGFVACKGIPGIPGILWSVDRTSGGPALLRLDLSSIPEIPPFPTLESPRAYGLAIDSEGNIWNTQNDGNQYQSYTIKFLPNGDRWSQEFWGDGKVYEIGTLEYGYLDRGAVVTLEDNDVWIANSGGDGFDGTTVTRLNSNGDDPVRIDLIVGGVQATGPTGLAVDHLHKVWVACAGTDNVLRIDPGDNHNGATVEEDPVSLGTGAKPYAYSDMTGQVTLHTTGTGTWNVTHDSGRFGSVWHTVAWNRECQALNLPTNIKVTVEVRAADVETELVSIPYTEVHRVNEDPVQEVGAWLEGIQGRYLQIRVRFVGSCPGETFATPVLCDLRAHDLRGDCNCDGLVNNLDITPFVKAISDPEGYAEKYPSCNELSADMNCDGRANNFDITPFVHCLAQPGPCWCEE